VAIRLNNLGLAWQALGEYQKALTLFEQAEKVFIEKLGENHPYTKSMREKIQYIKDKGVTLNKFRRMAKKQN